MPGTFSVDGYVNSVNIVNVGNAKKAYVNVSTMSRKPDKEGNKQYYNIDIQCWIYGEPSFDKDNYIVASGELQSYKDQNGETRQVHFADSIGVDPVKVRKPKDNGNSGFGGAQKQQNSVGYSARQNASAQQPRQTASSQRQGYRRPEDNPTPKDYTKAEGPELFQDENIPF